LECRGGERMRSTKMPKLQRRILGSNMKGRGSPESRKCRVKKRSAAEGKNHLLGGETEE